MATYISYRGFMRIRMSQPIVMRTKAEFVLEDCMKSPMSPNLWFR